MFFKFSIIAVLITSVMVSCERNQHITTDTGFYSFKEKWSQRNNFDSNYWTFDSVEVYEPVPNTLALRFILEGMVLDSVKVIDMHNGLSTLSAFFPYFIINPNTDIITNTSNIFPDDGRGRKAFLEAGYVSRYDAAAKTYYLHYYMTQNGRPDLIIHDTLTALP